MLGYKERRILSQAEIDRDMAAGSVKVPGDASTYVKRTALAPLWTTFITKVWLPQQHEAIIAHRKGERCLNAKDLAIASASCRINDFECPTPDANLEIAISFMASLRLRLDGMKDKRGTRWWPSNPLALIEAIRKERKKARGPYYEEAEVEVAAALMRWEEKEDDWSAAATIGDPDERIGEPADTTMVGSKRKRSQ